MRLKANILAGMLMSALATASQATVLKYKSFDQLVGEAEGVVVGTVSSVRVSPVGRPGNLHTYVTIDDVQALSGSVPEGRLTLRIKGGFDGRNSLHIDGAPAFSDGERVLLFVQGNGRDLVPFVGWGQGVFRLKGNGAGRLVVHDADDNEVIGIRQGHVLRQHGKKLDSAVLGAPQHVRQRGDLPRGGVERGDDGSPVQLVGVAAVAEPAMSADDFANAVRQQARAAAERRGALPPQARALRSVMPGERGAPDAAEGRDAAFLSSPAADTPTARPANGGVALPLPRPTPAASETR